MDRNKTHFKTYIVQVYIRVFSVVYGIKKIKKKNQNRTGDNWSGCSSLVWKRVHPVGTFKINALSDSFRSDLASTLHFNKSSRTEQNEHTFGFFFLNYPWFLVWFSQKKSTCSVLLWRWHQRFLLRLHSWREWGGVAPPNPAQYLGSHRGHEEEPLHVLPSFSRTQKPLFKDLIRYGLAARLLTGLTSVIREDNGC